MVKLPRIDPGRRHILALGGMALAAASIPATVRAQSAQSLKIGMIGSGREGGTLGTLWAKAGHKVMFSSRHPEDLKNLVDSAGPNASAGTVEQAVAFGDVIAIVVPYTAMAGIGKDYGAALATKALVFDVSNPIAGRDGEELVKSVNEQGGAALATAKILPGAKLVRAFNAIGFGKLAADANRTSDRVGIPMAGDNPQAIATASALISEIGFEPVLVGGLAMGKYLVPGTPLAGEHTPAEIRQIVAGLH